MGLSTATSDNSFRPESLVGAIIKCPVFVPPVEEPHPHVIVLSLVNTGQYLAVPGFSEGKPKVTQDVAALVESGFREDQVCVRMDNAKYLSGTGAWRGHQCIWMTHRFAQPDAAYVRRFEVVEWLNPEGLALIAEGLLRLAEHPTELIAPGWIKKLKRIVAAAK